MLKKLIMAVALLSSVLSSPSSAYLGDDFANDFYEPISSSALNDIYNDVSESVSKAATSTYLWMKENPGKTVAITAATLAAGYASYCGYHYFFQAKLDPQDPQAIIERCKGAKSFEMCLIHSGSLKALEQAIQLDHKVLNRALLCAVNENNMPVVETLIKKGAKDDDVVWWAAHKEYFPMAKFLIKSGMKHDNVVMFSVNWSSDKLAKILTELNIRDDRAVEYAIYQYKDSTKVKILLENGHFTTKTNDNARVCTEIESRLEILSHFYDPNGVIKKMLAQTIACGGQGYPQVAQ